MGNRKRKASTTGRVRVLKLLDKGKSVDVRDCIGSYTLVSEENWNE
jgi:hypothetical protein